MAAFVLDCSVTMAWCFLHETNTFADAVLEKILDSQVFVPVIWSYEVTNVLAVAQKRKRISRAKSEEFLALVMSLPIEVKDFSIANIFEETLEFTNRFEISSYDASYLALAHSEKCPLLTLDQKLKAAAKKLGLPEWKSFGR